MSNTPHPQADILRAIADGKTVQYRSLHVMNTAWRVSAYPLAVLVGNGACLEWRVEPETININGHEVPCPVREPLEDGQEFYLADVAQLRRPVRFYWSSTTKSMPVWLERGLIHLTEEAAIAHAEALLSFTRSDK